MCRANRILELGAGAGPVLGIDTGTPVAALGIAGGGRLSAWTPARMSTSHGSSLPKAIDELLAVAKLSFEQLAGIALGLGPGSFTGLRIGAAYAKGLAYASGLPIVGVPSLDAMAACAMANIETRVGATICPILDARRGEVYSALYRVTDDGLEKITCDRVVKLADQRVGLAVEPILVGEGVGGFSSRLIDEIGGWRKLVDLSRFGSRGPWVAALGAMRIAGGDLDRWEAIEPLYVRSPVMNFQAATVAREAQTGREALWSAGKRT
ncbi:MAG TPA: tRNA (adenosine(37)-N6)-threonylcarbamoyltransferase complex dimerization subunit type 1 TsaB [Candidatus Binataceae bacterium]